MDIAIIIGIIVALVMYFTWDKDNEDFTDF